MARRELVDAFTSGRMGDREFVTRLVATGMTLAAAVAFALSLAGSAHGASAKVQRATASAAVCASVSDFYSGILIEIIEITSCPEFLAVIGAPVVFDFAATPGQAVTYNLDFQQLGGIEVWKPASHNLQFNGLAPGYHTIRYQIASGLIASYTWIMPGPAPESLVVTNFGPFNSRATITWTSQIPAWRTYCSVNGSVERICRQPSGLTLNGLPAGSNSITIRATSGPGDPGRVAVVQFDRSDPAGTLGFFVDNPWGYFPPLV